MLSKKTIFVGLVAFSIPLVATANLTLVNNTKKSSTSVIGGVCSSQPLGQAGITPACGSNTLSSTAVHLVCRFKQACVAEVHMSSDCSGPTIATVIYDDSFSGKGYVSHTMSDNSYSLNGDESTITLNQNPPITPEECKAGLS